MYTPVFQWWVTWKGGKNLGLYGILAKKNNYVEKQQNERDGASKGRKLWGGKYMKKLIVGKGYIVKLVM